MMRFSKGTMVEVFCQTENPAGSWRCGEIIRVNGRDLIVKYYAGMKEDSIEEKVPRKFIRPSSPKMDFLENWKPGDVIEVLHNFSWKMATVSRVLSSGRFFVRLVGFFDEFEVTKSHIRLRQSWVAGKWVVIGKNSMNNDNNRNQKKPGHVMYEKIINLQTFGKPSTRMLKRKSPDYHSASSGSEDNDDATCSTSCSSIGSNDPFNLSHTTVAHPVEIERDCCSDAESVCWSYNEEMDGSSLTKEEMAAEIHRLELHAYRCTMKALHASGPFSWEQESLMTNLRISLHISNDEHLMELRTLISNSRNNTF